MTELSEREHEIVGLVAGGIKPKEIAKMLWVSLSDVHVTLFNSKKKSGARNTHELLWMYRNGKFLNYKRT